jgi:CubicO group peptidase (beta-lactamase class C family)
VIGEALLSPTSILYAASIVQPRTIGLSVFQRFSEEFQLKFVAAATLLCVLVSVADAAPGNTSTPSPAQASAPAQATTPHPLTPGDLEAYLDGMMPYALEQGAIAGAVVTVVANRQVVLSKGYGYADVARKLTVDPERTLFRAGSVSKLFTWTAVLQLVDAGKLDLDQDINAYLDFKIPPAWGRPVTLRNLMTHTAGFEEADKRIFFANRRTQVPLEDYIKSWTPARIFPPGEVSAYSNYGAALAGYIVQRISGQPFEDYVAQHLFAPLGMTHSTFAQPLPARLESDMSLGYSSASDAPQPFELVGPSPAGALSITGTDMARFMIAHLENGEYGPARILQADTAVLMHKPAYRSVSAPQINPMALGFYCEDRNGRRIIGHEGDTQLFHSDLHLRPDGTLAGLHDWDGSVKHWREVAPFVWRQVGGDSYIAAVVKNGRVAQLIDGDRPAPVGVLLPTPFERSNIWALPLFLVTLLVLLVAVIAWPLGAFRRWRKGQSTLSEGRDRLIHRSVNLVCLTALVFLGGWIAVVVCAATGNLELFDTPLDPWLLLLNTLGVICAGGTFVALYHFVLHGQNLTRWARVGSLLKLLSCVAIVWIAFTYRLVTFSVNY